MVKPLSGLRVTAVSLFLAVPSLPLWAQTASEHFPNDDGGANVQVPGTMNVTVVAKGVQNVKTNAVGGVPLTAGMTGADVAITAINKICEDAVTNRGLFCDGTIPAACTGLACCAATAVGTQSYDCDTAPGVAAGKGFTITRINTQTSFTVSPTADPTSVIQALSCQSPSGNTHGDDLLDRVLVRIDPNGVQGNVVFRVHHNQGGQNPRSFTVNTTGLSDQALHDAIATGYNAMGLGLAAVGRAPSSCSLSFARETLPGSFVEVTYSPSTQVTLVDFEVDGLRSGAVQGQIITTETAAPRCAAPLPAAESCPIDTVEFMADRATLTWTFPAACPLSMHFDAVRGDLSCLHGCNPLASCAACLAGENDDTDLMAVDTAAPPSGDGFWYLVRVDEGSWNSTGAAQCMDLDAVLPLGCP